MKRKANDEYSISAKRNINYIVDTFCDGKQVVFCERTGLTKGSVSQYCSGSNVPNNKTAKRIADAFGINPAWVMGFDVPMESKKEDTSTDGVQKNVQAEVYYLDDEAREMAEFLMKNPEYKVLFSGCRKVSPKDISFVKEFIDRVTKEE